MLTRTIIEAVTLPDAWFQLVFEIFERGRMFKIDQGSFAGHTRLEFDWVDFHIHKPFLRCHDGLPLIPEFPEGSTIPAPVDKDYIRQYARYIMLPDKAPGEQYTYGERLCKKFSGDNQISKVIDTYRSFGHRNNQMVLQVAQPTDIHLPDPPCLRQIDTRIQDNQLHFFPYFRSWDLWSGLPANLAGISMLQEYMANEIGVEQGEMICSSKGLHLYDFAIDLAALRTYREAPSI